jgi:transposase
LAIRQEQGKYAEIAQKYGVHYCSVYNIKSRKRWGWLQ